MTDEINYERKLASLINKADEFRDQDFRIQLEDFIKEAEEEIESLLAPYITNQSLPTDTRLNIIRVAGYLQHNVFLVPLKQIINKEPNIRMKQEAIIAVSKFNDRRALNILNTALQNLNNPLLASTINSEISRIKQNNPILSLMPRFMEGSKNPKTFKITLDVLKRILTPSDATVFTKYLDSEDSLIANGAYEILCFTGDIFHDSFILDFYTKRFNESDCHNEPECDDIYQLTFHLQQFLTRYQFLIEEQIPTLKIHFFKVKDIRAQTLYISIFCRSVKPATVVFMEDVYKTHPKLKKYIIEEFSGNEIAVGFLFNKLKQEEALRETIIKSLLNTKAGLAYFMENYFSLGFEVQEIVAQQLPYSGEHDLVEFIKNIFAADTFRLKEILLSKVKENFEFSVKDILFDPKNEREFSFMGSEYLDTISQLFPVSTVKNIFRKIVSGELSVSKTKKYLDKLGEIVPYELLFTLRDKEFILKLFNRIILSNNAELNAQFLGILKYIKTLDIETYRTLVHSLNLFITKREKNITQKEKSEFQRIKNSMNDMQYELKKIEEGMEEIKRAFIDANPNFDLLEKVLNHSQLSIVLNINSFIDTLVTHFEASKTGHIREWTKIFIKFPRISQLIAPIIKEKVETTTGRGISDLRKLAESMSDVSLRIVINFKDRKYTAILREQLQETVPHISISVDEKNPGMEDILLCDAESLNDLILLGKTIPGKIFIFLEKAASFAAFRSYNPRTFVQPFSFYRITREILQNIYS
jgi:hypothetical protein